MYIYPGINKNQINNRMLGSYFTYICIITAYNGVFGDQVIICENSEKTLQCNTSTTLHVITAMFGRAEKSVCGHNDTRLCSTSDALSVVGALCETKRTCRIPANKALFGESCGNIPSYVKVLYKCVDDRVNLPSHFIFNNNKAIHIGSSNNVMVAVGILGTLFTIAVITLAVIGIKKWKGRRVYRRHEVISNDDLDWSLYSSGRDNDFLNTAFGTPIYTGNNPGT